MPSDNALLEESDVTLAESREVNRTVTGMSGLYKLANWRDPAAAVASFRAVC